MRIKSVYTSVQGWLYVYPIKEIFINNFLKNYKGLIWIKITIIIPFLYDTIEDFNRKDRNPCRHRILP